MNRLVNKVCRFLSDADPRFLSLGLAALLEGLLVAFGGFSEYIVNHFTMVPCVFFLACLWKQPLSSSAKKLLLSGAAMVLWFLVVQHYHQATEGISRFAGPFFIVYLMALPFAAASGDGKGQLGLKLSGPFFLCGSLILAFFIGLLYMGHLPDLLQSIIYWDGARLRAMRHPNATGNCFLIAVGFSLYFFAVSKKPWRKAGFLSLAALFFLPIILTNSRTSILITCALFAGTVFFLIWKGGIKRFFLGAAAAAVTLVLIFSMSQVVFSLHEDHLIRSYVQEKETIGTTNPDLIIDQTTGEASLHTDSGQNSLIQDIGTLNARTSIWKSSIHIIREDPMILVRGTPFIGDLLTARHTWVVPHAHNSWLDTLLGLGLPGLLCALFFTGLALWNVFRICFIGNHALPRKIIALLTLCLLLSGIPENYVFFPTDFYPYANFVLFLCLGYLTQWKDADTQPQ